MLAGTPYALEPASASAIDEELRRLSGRVELLRGANTLTPDTLRDYYGERRFEQIAESNALEGSPFGVRETQLAIVRGITLTGHDPAWSRDARALHAALEKMVDLAARTAGPTTIGELHVIHQQLFGDRPGGGVFRRVPVVIGGAAHTPPSTWQEVMTAMEAWERWSADNSHLPAPFRAVVLHAWLVHVHPYIDGNGRTARAVTNLELIRAGYPPIIVRRKDRERYYAALAESGEGGDLGPLFELFLARIDDALRDLIRSAERRQGYDEVQAKLRSAYERRLDIWDRAVDLFASILTEQLAAAAGTLATASLHPLREHLELDDFIALCNGQPSGNTWRFTIAIEVPGIGKGRYLAWTGYRSHEMRRTTDVSQPGPSLFFSIETPRAYPRWKLANERAPGVLEMTVALPGADAWYCRAWSGEIERLGPSDAAARIAAAVVAAAADGTGIA